MCDSRSPDTNTCNVSNVVGSEATGFTLLPGNKNDFERQESVAHIEVQEKSEDSALTDRGYAWVVLVSSCLSHATFGFLLHGFAVLYNEMVEYFDASWASIGWVGSLCTTFFGLFGLCFSIAVNKFGCKISCMIGGCFTALGLVLSSFLVNIPYLCVTYGLITGSFSGLMLLSSIIIVQHHFNKKRPLANGIRSSFVNIGGLSAGPVLRYLVDHYGLRGALLLESGIILQSVVCGAMFQDINRKESDEKNKDIQTDHRDKVNCSENGSERRNCCTSGLLNKDIYKNKRFILYMIATLIQAIGITAFYQHIVNVAISIGISKGNSSMLVTVLNIGICIGASSFGFFANLPGYNKLLQMACVDLIKGFIIISVMFVTSFPVMMVLVGISGILGGSIFAIETTNLPDMVPMDLLATAQAIMMTLFGLSSVIGVPFAGFLVDVTGDYTLVLVLSGTLQSIASAFYMSVVIINWMSEKQYKLSANTVAPNKQQETDML